MRSIHSVLLLASATLFVSLFVACSSNDDSAAAPSRPPTPPPGNTSQVDGGGGDGGENSGDCFDTTKNKPVQQGDFLNQCNGTECFPFDNGARIDGYTAGAPLPPLN